MSNENLEIRVAKVKKLKSKLLTDIKNALEAYKLKMISGATEDDFAVCVKESFALMALQQYLEQSESFMTWEVKFHDFVTYNVSDKCLNVWLDVSYPFIDTYLKIVKKVNYDVFQILHDECLAREMLRASGHAQTILPIAINIDGEVI